MKQTKYPSFRQIVAGLTISLLLFNCQDHAQNPATQQPCRMLTQVVNTETSTSVTPTVTFRATQPIGQQVLYASGSYGYQFWLWQDSISDKPVPFVACLGNGDQKIFFDKVHKLVIVFTAGNYNKRTIKKNAYALMKDYIYPALINGLK